MKIRLITLLLLVPLLFACNKDNGNGNENGNKPQIDPETELPLIKSGDVLLATNANVEYFITSVTYPERDYSTSHILDDAYKPVRPGKDDIPAKYTLRWNPPASGEAVVTLTENTGWSRVYDKLDIIDNSYVIISNLLPNASYTYEVKAGDQVITSGSFTTTGHLHQVYFSAVRNSRDLGGWKTKDGTKTVKYRKIYRGGRLNEGFMAKGKRDLLAEGIKGQLDLRGEDDVLKESTLKGLVEDYAFCAPVIEEGYIWMLRDDQEKTKQCMQFIMQCVKENKPVYFHCSLGRDRTGTVAMMVLGLLGVDEGEISKEYEITQFAPIGYSVCQGETTPMTRKVDYRLAANYIWTFAGANGSFADGMQAYLLSIGITQAEIDEFRSLMLE